MRFASRRVAVVLLWYFALAGVVLHLVLAGAGWYAIDRLQMAPGAVAGKALERAKEYIPALDALTRPDPRYLDHALDGRLKSSHPRILLPGIAGWEGEGPVPLLAERARQYSGVGLDAPDACRSAGSLPALTACWLQHGGRDQLHALLIAVRKFQPTSPQVSGRYGNGWELAFAYDFLRLYPGLSADDRAGTEAKIERALVETLSLLDDPSPSLWHGRASLAASAWLCAIALDPETPERRSLQRRAQGHFLDVMQAWRVSEAWPEGYNYWIQNRGFLLSLAASAYLNGLEGAQNAPRIRETLRRAGYWHIYGTRPDNRAEGFGDEGSRVDLKDETQRVIDLMSQATRDPALAAYSRYIQGLWGRQGYYGGYRWGYRLFNDPALQPGGSDSGLQAFAQVLPRAELFGRGAMNLAYIRSDWGADATFIAFRAGNFLTHHGHYDAGHFTVFKGAPLAVNSSTYGGFTAPNRLYYSIRSIAKNTLLVLRPGERVMPNPLVRQNVSDGGQRVVMPTGSDVPGFQHWLDNLDEGQHLRGGRIEQYELDEEGYVYLRADLTAAYNTPDHDEGGSGGKVRRVVRELAYLFGDDRLLVHDRVVSVEPEYVKKWLLHTVNRPEMGGLRVLKGDGDNGILESRADTAVVSNGRGRLVVQRLLPADGVTRLVGGPDYQYYVESDADESRLDGTNFKTGAADKPWFDVAGWRLEIQPRTPRRIDSFLVALTPSVSDPRMTDRLSALPDADNIAGAYGTDAVYAFIESRAEGRAGFTIEAGNRALRLFGLPSESPVDLLVGGRRYACRSSPGGVCSFVLDPGARGAVEIQWS